MSRRTVYLAIIATCDYCHRETVISENGQRVEPPGWQDWTLQLGGTTLKGRTYPEVRNFCSVYCAKSGALAYIEEIVARESEHAS